MNFPKDLQDSLNFRAISRWLKNVFAFWRLLPLLHDQNIAGRGDTKRRQRETVTDSDRCCRPGWHHIRATRALWWRCLPNATRSKEETTQRSTKRGPCLLNTDNTAVNKTWSIRFVRNDSCKSTTTVEICPSNADQHHTE